MSVRKKYSVVVYCFSKSLEVYSGSYQTAMLVYEALRSVRSLISSGSEEGLFDVSLVLELE